MTEDEAKQKWCPFVRVIEDVGSSYNRVIYAKGDERKDLLTENACKCVASDCMMWRWGKTETTMDGVQYHPAGSGHCGLARHEG